MIEAGHSLQRLASIKSAILRLNCVFFFYCKALSYTVGFVSRKRPFSTEAQVGVSYTVEKGLFRLNFFRLSFPIGGSSGKT